jgi:amino acid transporter
LPDELLIANVMQVSLGEMIAYLPIPGGHIKLAERFVDGAFSFTMGWNYWYNWTIILPAELSAASVLVDFWDKDTNLNSLWIVICIIVVVFINFLGAGTALHFSVCILPYVFL